MITHRKRHKSSTRRNTVRRQFRTLSAGRLRRRSAFEALEARQMLAGNILLEDNFDSENGGIAPRANYYAFANWNVTDGSMDLIDSTSTAPTLPAANGLFVDLDGSTGNAGRLESKTLFSLAPGDYLLSFELAGPQSSTNAFGGPNPSDSVDVSLGGVYSERFTKAYADPFATIERRITVNAATSGRIVFDHLGGDYVGLILDNVKLTTNDAPVAVNDSYSVNEDMPLIVSALGVLGNDSDTDGDTLTANLVSGTAHGLMTFNGDGSFSYTPEANFNGTDSFSYKANDGLADSNIAVVTITVNPVYDPPVAHPQSVTAMEDIAKMITLTATADNPVHFHITSLPANGKLFEASGMFGWPIGHEFTSDDFGQGTSFVAGPTFTYVGNPNFNGTDSFQFKASDGFVLSAAATLTIDVQPVNDAPVTHPQTVIATEDVPQTITVTATDPDSAVHFHVHSLPANGKLIEASGLFGWPIGHEFTMHDLMDIGGGSVVAGPMFTYFPNVDFNGTDSFRIRASDGFLAGSVELVTLEVWPVNDAPTANAGPDQTSAEGSAVQFSATAADVDGDELTFFWEFGDGGSGVGLTSIHVYADNGIYTATLTVQDTAGATASDTLTVSVANVAPTASVSGPSTGVPGQPRLFTLAAGDPSSVDQTAGFTYVVNWGDGSAEQTIAPTAGNGSGASIEHVYVVPGSYTVTTRATDKDDGASAPTTRDISITVVGLQPDPFDLAKTALAVGGTSTADNIVFSSGPNPGGIAVSVNGVSLGVFPPTGRLIAYGQAGDDDIQVAGSIALVAELHGQADEDRLKGGAGHDLLLGGDGDDLLVGGGGRDLLIGGTGADRIVGNAADDILIAGTTAFDQDHAALCAIMAEWTQDRDYATRTANISGTGNGASFDARQNANYFLTTQAQPTVSDDAARDTLTGSAGQDWFFANLEAGVLDKVTDLSADEFQPDLEFILSE